MWISAPYQKWLKNMLGVLALPQSTLKVLGA